MENMYIYTCKCDLSKMTQTEAIFFDMFDAVVNELVVINKLVVEKDKIEIWYSPTEYALLMCKESNVEVPCFLDDLAIIFDKIRKFHYQYPLQASYSTLEELKEDIRAFSCWVSEMILDGNANQITKQNYLNIRSA